MSYCLTNKASVLLFRRKAEQPGVGAKITASQKEVNLSKNSNYLFCATSLQL
jgi:hypothetical protein